MLDDEREFELRTFAGEREVVTASSRWLVILRRLGAAA